MSVTTDFPASSGSITINTPTYTKDPNYLVDICPNDWTYNPSRQGIITNITEPKGGDDMRYLYEVILVNPKNDTFYVEQYIARTDTSALMEVYHNSQFYNSVEFDDLKTSCRVLMEWKKKKSLKKAIETIKEAVE